MSRIAGRFQALARERRKALIPYITAGDPDPSLTVPLMRALVEAGADIIELGVPFSDPMADGPVIQRASERALKHGVGLRDVLALVARFRSEDAGTPVVLMGYANPIEAMGMEKFVDAAQAAGVDGVIVVDYPPEECVQFADALKRAGIDPVFLLAPTSTDERIGQVARVGSGYLYYVSLRGDHRRRAPRPGGSHFQGIQNSGSDAASHRRGLRHPRRGIRAPCGSGGRCGGHRQPPDPGDRGRRAG